ELAQHHGRAISIVAHAGDGNLHPTVQADDTPEEYAAAEEVLSDISELAVSLGGTITGEHGIGAVKHHELPIQLDQAVITAQHAGRAICTAPHAGDGNRHPTGQADDTPEEYAAAEEVLSDIAELAVSLGGTITGEHGIGAVKHHELPIQLDQAVITAQHAIKHALDPAGILTPGRAI